MRSDSRMIREQGNKEDRSNSQDSERRSRSQPKVHNQIVIQNPTGLVHLGPVYNINIGQAFTQVNKANSAPAPPSNKQKQNVVNEGERKGQQPPSKEFMRPLWYSSRVIQGDELMRLSKNIGAEWKSVGNGLKFNWSQLDQFESDTRSHSEAVHRMLYRWLQWKDQKATVGRLTKVLFNHKEYEAIHCITP